MRRRVLLFALVILVLGVHVLIKIGMYQPVSALPRRKVSEPDIESNHTADQPMSAHQSSNSTSPPANKNTLSPASNSTLPPANKNAKAHPITEAAAAAQEIKEAALKGRVDEKLHENTTLREATHTNLLAVNRSLRSVTQEARMVTLSIVAPPALLPNNSTSTASGRGTRAGGSLWPNNSTNPTVIFHLHIPKSGGTALSYVLVSSPGCNCPVNIANIKPRPSMCKCRRVRLAGRSTSWIQSRLSSGWICGVHAFLSTIKNCSLFDGLTIGGNTDQVRIVTFLRDPVERILSEYRECGSRGKCWDWGVSGNISLANYLSLDNSFPFQNRQMKMVSGCPVDSNWTNHTTCRICLHAAKENIARFGFVGLHEDFHLLTGRLQAWLGVQNISIPTQWYSQHKRAGSKYSQILHAGELSRAELKKISHKNIYDYELYNFTKALLLQ